jgi:hypothetical protein
MFLGYDYASSRRSETIIAANERPFSVFLRHRPRRVAFLLDPDCAEGALLDAIVDFNVECWGGRYNPVIPVTNKSIWPDYWRLLRLANPDVIYCFHEIDQLTIEQLDRELGPMLIRNHKNYGQASPVRISLEDQASTKAIILRLRDLFPSHLRRPEPSILAFNFDRGDQRGVSAFVRRNFGVSWNAHVLARDHGIPATYPNSTSDADVLDSISKYSTIALPIGVCRHAPLDKFARAMGSGDNFTITFGDSAWNFIHFWNDAYFQGINKLWNLGVAQMWLPPQLLQDAGAYANLLAAIKRRVHSGNNHKRLRIISYDHDVQELESLVVKLCTDLHSGLHRGPAERVSRGDFPAVDVARPIEFSPKLPQHEHVRGERVFLELDKPDEVSSEGTECWMVDLRVDDPLQEPFFVNLQPWWKLPKVCSLASLFSRPRASRVVEGGRLTVEVANREEKLPLEIPTKAAIFGSLLSPGFWYTSTSDLRHALARPPITSIRLSDKGKYLNGVLDLFPSLRSAVYMFEHPFWRETLLALCCPRKSDQVRSKAKKTILKQADAFIANYATDKNAAGEWLAEMILQASERIPGVEESLRFEDLQKNYQKYVAGLSSPSDAQYASDINLRDYLSELTRATVLLQGSEVRCRHCLSEFWYHVDDLGRTIACRGCRRDIPLPAENAWSYRPNDLVRKGLREYGLLPVIRLIGRLFEKSEQCFLFLSGLELGNYEARGFVSKGEIDLSWISDGEFGMAEVKTSTKGFSTSEAEKLVKWASIARPKRILLVAVEGDDTEIAKWRGEVEAQLKQFDIQVEAWGPSFFAIPSLYLV